MEKKNNISKEEFLNLFKSTDAPKLEHLDDFEKEALEGLNMMKNPSALNSIDEKIDKKLDELVAAEKKGGKRAGMYLLSIAASIALVIGLFFIFKQTEPSLKNDVASIKDTEEKNVEVSKDLEELKPNSDAQIAPLEKDGLKNEQLRSLKSGEKMPDEGLLSALDAKGDVTSITKETSDKKELTKVTEGYVVDDREADKPVPAKVATEATNELSDNVTFSSKNDGNLSLNDNTKLKEKDSKVNQEYKAKTSVAKKGEVKEEESNKTKSAVPANNNDESNVVTILGTTTQTSTLYNAGASANMPSNVNGTVSNNSTTAANIILSEFIGGKNAQDDYIKTNLKVPTTCVSEEIIIVKFNVSELGKISKAKIISKTGNCADCEKQAILFINKMPNWKPALQNGKAIASKQQLILSFKK